MNKQEFNTHLLELWQDEGYTISEFADEYHTFNELYTQRLYLSAALFNAYPELAWKSARHDDGEMFPGYFIVGINTPSGQLTYHYKLKDWDLFKVPIIDVAPKWDGHTAADVARLMGVTHE